MVLQSNLKTDVAAPLDTYTFAEISQQPALWPTTLERVRRSGWTNHERNRPVIITGAGTSAYAAAAIAGAWPNAQAIPTTDLLIETRAGIERASPDFPSSGLLISLGRSGDSPESLAVVNRVKKLCPDADHLAITCNPDGQLAKTAGVYPIVLDPRTNDRGLAMTSSFTNLVLAGLGLQHGEEVEAFLPQVCENVQQRLEDIDAQARRLTSAPVDRVVILGSGSLTALAAEAGLKILEMTAGRTATLAESFLGLRHGPMSFVTPDALVLCFLSSSSHRRRYEEDLIRELRQKGLGRIVAIAPDASDGAQFHDRIPANAGHVRDELRVPFEIPFAQLLAYHLSCAQGLNPDNPSPQGAITRVVQNFVIYDDDRRDV